MTITPNLSPNLLACSVCADERGGHSEAHCRFGECGEKHEGHLDQAVLIFPRD